MFKNPVTVASGTFAHAEKYYSQKEVPELGAIVPKTVTLPAQEGNPPQRIIETPAGMLNAIGIDDVIAEDGWAMLVGLLALLLVIGFLLGVKTLGVFLLLPPLLGGVMAIMGERRPGTLVAVPLLFDLFVYVVFYRVFSVDLPTLLL